MNLLRKIKKIPLLGPILLKLKSKFKKNSPAKIFFENSTDESVFQKKRIAVIGLGPQGRAICSAAQSLGSNIEIAAIADLNIDNINQVKNQLNKQSIFSTTDYKDFNKIGSVDLICIATSAATHYSIAIEIIKMKICTMLLVEKPFVSNLRQADDLILEAKQNGIQIYVNHTRQWLKNYLRLNEIIKSKQYGNLQSVSVFFGAGGMINLGVHFLELLRLFFTEEPTSVISQIDSHNIPDRRGEIDPGGRAWINYSSGKYAFLDFSQDLKFKGKKLIFNTTTSRIEFDEKFGTIEIFNDYGKTTLPALQNDLQGHNRVRPVLAGILNQTNEGSTGDSSRKTIELLESIKLSAQTGDIVKLPLVSITSPNNLEASTL